MEENVNNYEPKAGHSNRTVIICGGTGAIGVPLSIHLVNKGFKVIIFTRDLQKAVKTRLGSFPSAIKFVPWYGLNLPHEAPAGSANSPARIEPTKEEMGLISLMEDCYAIINLAGKSMYSSKRITKKDIQDIRFSKVNVIRHIGYLIRHCQLKPKLFLNASSIEFYGKFKEISQQDEQVVEQSAFARDFWGNGNDIIESESRAIARQGVHIINLRIGFVIDSNSDFFSIQVEKFKKGNNVVIGTGKQWFPWIHIDDVVGIIEFLLRYYETRNSFEEPVEAVNVVSAGTVRQEDFVKILTEELKLKKHKMKSPEWYLKVTMGKPAGFLAKSRRVVPERIQHLGYRFLFLSLQAAIKKELSAGSSIVK